MMLILNWFRKMFYQKQASTTFEAPLSTPLSECDAGILNVVLEIRMWCWKTKTKVRMWCCESGVESGAANVVLACFWLMFFSAR